MFRKKPANKNFLIIPVFILAILLSTLNSSCINETYRQNKKAESLSKDKLSVIISKNKTNEIQLENKSQTQPQTETQLQSQPEKDYEVALVTRVIDGDTIIVLLNGKEEKVRLIGIDTPERGRPYFYEATKKTAELVLGKKVKLVKDVSERDRYGRLLRYVYVGNLFVNAELVRQGFAMVYTYPPDVKFSEYFLKLQQEARKAKQGLWGEPADTNKSESPSFYVASKRSEVFHNPNCPYAKKIASYNLIKFKSRDEAINSGRRPCRVCKP